MNSDSAKNLVRDTFQRSFSKEQFVYFAKNLLNSIDSTKEFQARGYIRESFKDYIKTYERIGTYTDPSNKRIDVLIVYLKKETTLEQARTAQRNFVADYLKNRGEKDAGLVVFVSPDPEDWRFSFVKMEYVLAESPKGKIKAKEEFTPARRYSFLVGTHENSHTAQSRLMPILQDDQHNPSLGEIEEAFSIERVTREFFEKYRELFYRVDEALEKIISEDSAIEKDFDKKNVERIDFAKKLLGQIVFLYFLQKKGWFGVKRHHEWGTGSKNFLRELFEKKHGDYANFFDDILEPLFYNTLAIERPKDYSDRFDCKIPFLNGGLFDPLNDYDWIDTDILLPNNLFSNTEKTKEGDIGTGILDVFDRYNFTVKEDEPLEKEVAVDPEMLGKVFENLLEVKDRKSKGTYYTPREIVHYMCQESLNNYLYAEINSAQATMEEAQSSQSKLFGKSDPEQIRLKTNTKEIVTKEDLETLVKYGEATVEHDALYIEKSMENPDYKGKYQKAKLPSSIEKHARSIDEKIANIRVCDPAVGSGAFLVGMMNEIVRTRNVLTNFIGKMKNRTIYDFKRHAIQNCLYGVDIDSGAVEIAKLRLWLSLVVDEEDIKQIKPLPNLDYKIVCGNSLLEVEKNLFNNEQFKQLEELKPYYFDETNMRRKQEYKEQIDELISQITNGRKDFDFEVYFSEVFHEKDGFDIVIANPPYDEISNKEDKKLFQKLFGDVLSGHYDLYIFFFKRAFDIAKGNGVISFITPHTYLHYPQFINLRRYIYERGHIIEISNRISGIFESAVVDNSIILIHKGQDATKMAKFSYKQIQSGSLNDTKVFFLKKEDFDSTNFDIQAIKNREIFKRYTDATEPLGAILASSQGITVYAKVQGPKKNWFRSSKVDDNSKPVIRGRDIQRYFLQWTGRYIQYGDWLWCPRDKKFFENEKLLFRQTADSLIGTYWKEPIYCLDSVHSIICMQGQKRYHLKYILAILNSTFGNYLYKLLITETGKVFAQVKLTFLRQIPIKKITQIQQKPLIALVDKILVITKDGNYQNNQAKQAKVKEHEHQIDQIVYKLYDLSEEEIKMVGETFDINK